MKRTQLGLIAAAGLFLSSCDRESSLDNVVSQKYVHKYGFDVSENEWNERSQDGQVVELLKSGVKITRSYENGQLHGETTHTFPDTPIVEKSMVYDQGTLLKETIYDEKGSPVREEIYEFDDRTIVTLWSEEGVPLSVEEYELDKLIDGQYFTLDHELEGKVENGYGTRYKRTREGALLSKDLIKNGQIKERSTYHPNGELHTVSRYHNSQLHGLQQKFTTLGRPQMELTWNHGVLDGTKTVYRNGIKVAEIPYIGGEKNGTEYHFDDLGNMISETMWKKDKKHGCCKYYTEDSMDSEWYHEGMVVDAQKFVALENRKEMLAELSLDN